MKTILSILFVAILAIGTAQAQLASDKPAPLPPATNSITKAPTGPIKLASEIGLPDSLKAKIPLKTPLQANDKNLKLASETEAPKSTAKEKN